MLQAPIPGLGFRVQGLGASGADPWFRVQGSGVGARCFSWGSLDWVVGGSE
jgi:hypothetical protein